MIRQTSAVSSRQKTNIFFATKTLSSQATTTEPKKPSYIQQRIEYNQELTALRKGWTAEIQLKKEREAARYKAERERIVLVQAVRLREDRAQVAINVLKAEKRKIADGIRIRQHLARNEVVRQMKDKVQQQRFSRMVQDVHEESRVWITKDNLNQKINEDLFETEATTGLVTRSSQHWRYYALTYQFGPNMLDPDGTGDVEDEEDMDDEASRRAARNLRKMTEEDFPEDRTSIHRLAELFVQPMINTGAERERFKEIVQQVGDSLQYMDKVQISSKEGNYEDRISTNWLEEKLMKDWDSEDDEEEDAEYDRQQLEREKEEERYAKPKKSWDKYTIESDESGDEAADIDDIDDDSVVDTPKPKLKKGAKVPGRVPKKR